MGYRPHGDDQAPGVFSAYHMTKTTIRPTTWIFSSVAALMLISLAGCASDKSQTATTESSSATMTTDTKDMSHPANSNSH